MLDPRPVPFPWQEAAWAWLEGRKRSLLRMDTGLGKTRTYLEWAASLGARRVLLIAPGYTHLNWEKQIELWMPQFYPYPIKQPADVAAFLHYDRAMIGVTTFDFYINPEKVRAVSRVDWDVIIIDEAHRIKNWEAKRTQNIITKVCRKRKYILAGTATPFTLNAKDLHPIFSLMQPGKWGKYIDFQKKYCEKTYNFWKREWEWTGVNEFTAEKLKEKSRAFTFAVKKRDVQKDLPPLRTLYVDLDVDTSGLDDITDRMRLRKELGKLKVPLIFEFIRDNISEERCVIFCNHISVARLFFEALPTSGLITGKVSNAERQKNIDDFQKKKYQFLVCTYGAGSEGVDATAASIVISAELPWSYRELKQARDRVMRTGQKKKVTHYIFTAIGTQDENGIEILANKISNEEKSIGHIE